MIEIQYGQMKNAIMIGVFVLMNVKQGYVVNFLDNQPISTQRTIGRIKQLQKNANSFSFEELEDDFKALKDGK